MNFISKNLKKAGKEAVKIAGLSALLVSPNACRLFDIVEPSVEKPRIVSIRGPSEVAPGASYSLEVFAEQGNLVPVIEIRRQGGQAITGQSYILRANYVAAPIPGEEVFYISARSVPNAQRHDTTYTIPRR